MHFFVTKVIPVLAILAIYGLGTLNLSNAVFLPASLSIAALLFWFTRKYGDKKEKE